MLTWLSPRATDSLLTAACSANAILRKFFDMTSAPLGIQTLPNPSVLPLIRPDNDDEIISCSVVGMEEVHDKAQEAETARQYDELIFGSGFCKQVLLVFLGSRQLRSSDDWRYFLPVVRIASPEPFHVPMAFESSCEGNLAHTRRKSRSVCMWEGLWCLIVTDCGMSMAYCSSH